MHQRLRRPEEILAFRPLRQVLAWKPPDVWSVRPDDSVLTALRMMADRNIGLVLVLDRGSIAGVVSERDCARKVVLAGRPPDTTPVADIMVRQVITAELGQTFGDCLKLMHHHGIRHLPVVESGAVVAVISIRDLLGEAVAHQAKIIAELERERLTVFTSTA